MKKHIKFFILGVFSVITLNAQNTVKPVIAVEPDAMNVLYAGLHNPLDIAYSGATTDQLYIVSDIGTITKDSSVYYNIFIPNDQVGELVNISVYLNKEKQPKKLIGIKQFRVKPVPEPVPYLGSKTEGKISTGELRLINFISVRLDDFAFEGLKYTVHKYTFTYIPKSGTTSKLSNTDSAVRTPEMKELNIDTIVGGVFEISSSAALTPEMKELISKSKSGDKIIISDIWASFPEGEMIKLSNNIELTVK